LVKEPPKDSLEDHQEELEEQEAIPKPEIEEQLV
jgi:hypothetical protein